MAYLLSQLLDRSARQHGSRPAVIERAGVIDYRELHRRAGRIGTLQR